MHTISDSSMAFTWALRCHVPCGSRPVSCWLLPTQQDMMCGFRGAWQSLQPQVEWQYRVGYCLCNQMLHFAVLPAFLIVWSLLLFRTKQKTRGQNIDVAIPTKSLVG